MLVILVMFIILPLTSVAKLNDMSLYWYVLLSHMGSVSSVTKNRWISCVCEDWFNLAIAGLIGGG